MWNIFLIYLSHIMIHSMTAFGRASHLFSLGRFDVEISSVNRKYLEIYSQMPKELNYLEFDIKKWLKKQVYRGQLTFNLRFYSDDYSPICIKPNLGYAKQIHSSWKELQSALGLTHVQFDLNSFCQDTKLFVVEDDKDREEEFKEEVFKAIKISYQNFLQTREIEGEVLQHQIQEHMECLDQDIDNIQEATKGLLQTYQLKLENRLKEFIIEDDFIQEKIIREVAIYADKSDITEEIVRFKFHIKGFLDKLNSNIFEAKGKQLEFIVQEMFREINTIGSKAHDLKISQWVISIKGELEKIKEQLQNVE